MMGDSFFFGFMQMKVIIYIMLILCSFYRNDFHEDANIATIGKDQRKKLFVLVSSNSSR